MSLESSDEEDDAPFIVAIKKQTFSFVFYFRTRRAFENP